MADPLIGVTTYQGKNAQGLAIIALLRAYVDALVQAGSIPVLIPSCLNEESARSLFLHLDGLLFTGGGDIDIDRFNGEPHSSIDGVDKERDSNELALLRTFIKGKKPFLGICRGFQLITVGLGGTLYTHIEDQKPGAQRHDFYPDFPRNYLAHIVKLKSGSRLRKIIGEEVISVNSLHHQGAKDIPGTLTATAFAPDGLVEAVELPDHPFGMAVQWHPEWLTDQTSTRRLFRSFVAATQAKNENP